MPSMSIHTTDLERTTVRYVKSLANDMGWIELATKEQGSYLTIYLVPREGAFRTLLELQAMIDQALAHLVALRMESSQDNDEQEDL